MNRNRLALYPGSFDPFTYGHLDILRRAARLFDEVEVTVAVNRDKTPLFTAEERCSLIEEAIPDLANVTVVPFEGLLVDHAQARGATALIRGLRQVGDFDYEFRMAFANRKLAPGIETVLLMTSEAHAFTSASIVRDVYRWGGDVGHFVPECVVKAMEKKRAERLQ